MAFHTASLAALFSFALVSQGSCQKDPGAGDVTKDKVVAEVNLVGVDTAALTAREKREWSGYVARFKSHCPGSDATISSCIDQKKDCNLCVPEAKFILKAVHDGYTEEQVEKAYAARFDPTKVKMVDEDESPTKGPANAPVTIVEFADFECPFCGAEMPVMNKAFETNSPNVRFVYKLVALPMHAHAEPAARAAFAAYKQGKFWEMHDKLFGNQQALQNSDFETYAKDLGLDIPKFKTDLNSTSAMDRIQRDKKTFDTIGAKGTPTILINGRDFDPRMDINEWIALEIQLKGGAVAPTTRTAASAPLATGSTSATSAPETSAKATAGAAPTAPKK